MNFDADFYIHSQFMDPGQRADQEKVEAIVSRMAEAQIPGNRFEQAIIEDNKNIEMIQVQLGGVPASAYNAELDRMLAEPQPYYDYSDVTDKRKQLRQMYDQAGPPPPEIIVTREPDPDVILLPSHPDHPEHDQLNQAIVSDMTGGPVDVFSGLDETSQLILVLVIIMVIMQALNLTGTGIQLFGG